MTNTKWLSALLAGTALSVASTAAMADSTFLTMTRNAAGQGVTFSVAPTADMPASVTEVTVSGEVRSLLTTTNPDGDDNSSDVSSRGRVFVKGVTQTAVGEVGANLRIGASGVDKYTGHWKISDTLTLSGGKSDSLSSVQYGADWNATGGVWDGSAAGLTNPGVDFVRLTMTSGPVTAAVGIETNTTAQNGAYRTSSGFAFVGGGATNMAVSDSPSIAASVSYDGGAVTGQIVGRMQSGQSSTGGSDVSAHMIGAGIGFTADMFSIQAGAASGKGMAYDYTYLSRPSFQWDNGTTGATSFSEASFSAASVLAVMNVSETTRLEAFAGMAKVDADDFEQIDGNNDVKVSGFGAGAFYAPVSQLTLGAGVSSVKVTDEDDDTSTSTTAGIGAWFSF